MITRGGQTLTWDIENRLLSVSENGTTAQYVYDGNGARVKKTEGGETVVYVNQYFEKNITTGNSTSSYYLGGRLIATLEQAPSESGTLRYVHQDHLTSTSLMTDSVGTQIGDTVKYLPFGEARGKTAQQLLDSTDTDKLFTGQRLDGTGLYYYNARYYDPTIGRFISADTVIPNMANPQCFNRYTYCLNNPLKYTDPSGHKVTFDGYDLDHVLASGDYMTMVMIGTSKAFQAYMKLRDNHSNYTSYLETTEKEFIVTSSNNPSEDNLKKVEEGSTFLKLESSSSGVDVRRYTPDGFWNFLTSGRVIEAKRPPVDWGEIKQKFADADWDGLGRGVTGALEIAVGSILTVGGAAFATAVMLPYATQGIPPQDVLQSYTYFGISSVVDGVNRASNGKAQWDINWMPYPIW